MVVLFISVALMVRFRDCTVEEDVEDLVKDEVVGEDGEAELDWDDSALTITINPMDVRKFFFEYL